VSTSARDFPRRVCGARVAAIMQPIYDRQCIQLSLGGRNLKDLDFLSKSDPFVVLYVRDEDAALAGFCEDMRDALVSVASSGGQLNNSMSVVGSGGTTPSKVTCKADLVTSAGWTLLGKTETVWDNLDPDFVSKFYFPSGAPEANEISIRAVFYDEDNDDRDLSKHDLIGFCEFKLREVLLKGTLQVQLMNAKGKPDPKCGMGYFVGEELDVAKAKVRQFDIEVCFGPDCHIPRGTRGPREMFFILKRLAKGSPSSIDGTNAWISTYRSGKATPPINPGQEFRFQECNIDSLALYADDEERPFRLELYIYNKKGNHLLAGTAEMTLKLLRREFNDKCFPINPGIPDAMLIGGSVSVFTAWSRAPTTPNNLTLRIGELQWAGPVKDPKNKLFWKSRR